MKSESELESLREEAVFRRAMRRHREARCRKLAEEGLSLADIALRVGASRYAVHQALVAVGLRLPHGRRGAPLGLPSR